MTKEFEKRVVTRLANIEELLIKVVNRGLSE